MNLINGFAYGVVKYRPRDNPNKGDSFTVSNFKCTAILGETPPDAHTSTIVMLKSMNSYLSRHSSLVTA